jgi:hypothetical protein
VSSPFSADAHDRTARLAGADQSRSHVVHFAPFSATNRD